MRYVLDTHALVWYFSDDPRLGDRARVVLEDGDSQLVIPVMVLAEAKHIANKKRIPLEFEAIVKRIVGDPRCVVFPMDMFVISHMPADLDIHDSIIVATALHCRSFFADEIALLTVDGAIHQSGHIPTVW